MTLGKKLQLLRKSRGMSQEQLAEALEVSRQAVSKWELDQTLPDTANVVALGKMFGVTTDYLLLEEPAVNAAPQPEHKRRDLRTIAGIIFAAFGALGEMAIFVVSRFVKVVIPIRVMRDGKIWTEYNSSHTGIDLKCFMEEYHLTGLAVFLGLLALAGIVMIFWDNIKDIRKKRAARS